MLIASAFVAQQPAGAATPSNYGEASFAMGWFGPGPDPGPQGHVFSLDLEGVFQIQGQTYSGLVGFLNNGELSPQLDSSLSQTGTINPISTAEGCAAVGVQPAVAFEHPLVLGGSPCGEPAATHLLLMSCGGTYARTSAVLSLDLSCTVSVDQGQAVPWTTIATVPLQTDGPVPGDYSTSSGTGVYSS
jgi:hypothetical protein